MTAKIVVLISSVFFWSFGILTVMAWHNQQSHERAYQADPQVLRTINTTAPKHCAVSACFVDLKQ